MRLFLGHNEGSPTLSLLDLDTAEALAIPSAIDSAGAFDEAVALEGWVAVRMGNEVMAYRDGALTRGVRLPACSTVARGRLGAELVLKLDEPGETFAVVGADGHIRRTVTTPTTMPPLRGEIGAGLVFDDATVLGWDGSLGYLPVEGTPVGVLGGELVVVREPDRFVLVDADGSEIGSCALLERLWDPTFDASAQRAVWRDRDGRTLLIADRAGGPRLLQMKSHVWDAMWVDETHLLLRVDSPTRQELELLDLSDGSTQALALPRTAPELRLCVGDRFDFAATKAVLRPTGWRAPTPAERDETLEAQRAEYAGAARPGLVAAALPSIALRSYLPARREPLGGSRLGGRPDLPVGVTWPSRDNVPMAFLAQLRLEELAPCHPEFPLPVAGLVLFFVALDPDTMEPVEEAATAVAVVTAGPGEVLKRAAWPKSLDEGLRFEPALLQPGPALSLPNGLDYASDAERHAWWELVDRSTRTPHHALLGHPKSGQDHAAPVADGTPLSLLLQLDSDGISGMSFGDGGSLQIWATPELVPRQVSVESS